MHLTNLSYCEGRNCSKREQCIHSTRIADYNPHVQIVDYSTRGSGYSTIDEHGNSITISKTDCGDESDDYQYFTPVLQIQEEPISIRQISQNICQLFENILDKHNIDIPDPDREISEEDSSQAHIYGVTYFTLEDEVTEILAEFANRIKRDDIKIQTDTY